VDSGADRQQAGFLAGFSCGQMAVVVHLFQFIYTWTSKDPDVIFTLAVLTHEMEISGCSPI